jgi:hypothetical protein
MYKYLIIFVLLLVVLLLLNSRSAKNTTTIVTNIDTIYHDTTIVKYKKGNDIAYKVINNVHDSVQIYVHDTISIVKDYLTVKEYSDTFHIDTNNYVSIQDTISQNRIIGRSYNANLKEKTILVTNDIHHYEKNSFYIGPIVDLRRLDNNIGIGVGVSYKLSKKAFINLAYTTNQISFGYYIKF